MTVFSFINMHFLTLNSQLQLSTESQLHTTIMERSQSQKTSNQIQLKSLHAGGNFHAHGILSVTQELCSPCVSPTSTSHAPLAFPTSQTQAQTISEINPNSQPNWMPSSFLLNNLQSDPLIQNTTQHTSAPSYTSVLKSVPNLNKNKPTKKIFGGYYEQPIQLDDSDQDHYFVRGRA